MIVNVNLFGTSKSVIRNIIHDNASNGLKTTGSIMNDLDEEIFQFVSLVSFNNWWKNKYGNSDIGNDHSYIVINIH